jgi:two-component system LytT family response regulator
MIRGIIVENEHAPAEILKSHLQSSVMDFEILDVCETVEASVRSIKKYLPDLVFLDVELNNNENGFEILKKLDLISFEIIVTTSFDKYALNAIKASAIDFLVKPLLKEDVIEAIRKYRARRNKGIDPRQIELLLSIYQNSTLSIKKFALPTMTGLIFVETGAIEYFEGAGNQTMVYFTDGKKECISALLKDCEKLLLYSSFSRIHKSYLINIQHVKQYFKGKDGAVVMTSKTTLPVSREYKDEFLRKVAAI